MFFQVLNWGAGEVFAIQQIYSSRKRRRKKDLDHQQCRNEILERTFHRFVSEKFHGGNGSGHTACESQKKQPLFRDPPPAAERTQFVSTIDKKGDHGTNDPADHHMPPPLRGEKGRCSEREQRQKEPYHNYRAKPLTKSLGSGPILRLTHSGAVAKKPSKFQGV